LQQGAKHILSGHVALLAFLKNFQNLETRQRGLESGVFKFVDLGHVALEESRSG
jgi:hypothetical protein